ncbi:MAG: hypothetical protein JRI97_02875 [Deltaproteobacteria bacterium]|nr:hypothetical protein [Deltaproteobacteria bacterium]
MDRKNLLAAIIALAGGVAFTLLMFPLFLGIAMAVLLVMVVFGQLLSPPRSRKEAGGRRKGAKKGGCFDDFDDKPKWGSFK